MHINRRVYPFVAALLLLFVVAGCASTSSGEASSGERADAEVLGPSQLQGLGSLTLYEAIDQMRPEWFRGRGSDEVKVHVNGSLRGGPDALRYIDVNEVQQVVHRTGRDASTRFGAGYSSGMIDVTLK